MFGCGRFRVGVGEAKRQARTVLSALLENIVALSAAKRTSVTASSWANDCTGLRNSWESGWPAVNGVFQVSRDLSEQAPARMALLGENVRLRSVPAVLTLPSSLPS